MRGANVSDYRLAEDITEFDASIPVHEEPEVEDKFALVLLKQDGILGPLFYLELRDKKDPVYPGRLGPYGGVRLSGETPRYTATREVEEETGIQIGEDDLIDLFHFAGQNSRGDENEGDVFLYKLRFRLLPIGGPGPGSIRSWQRNRKRKLQQSNDEDMDIFGSLFVVRRWFWTFFDPFLWQRLSPAAAYALLADHDRDRRRRGPRALRKRDAPKPRKNAAHGYEGGS